MRVALYSARMFGYSGVELYTLDLALALAHAGHKISVHSESWADHLRVPLLEADVEPTTFGAQLHPEVCIAPKYLPLHAAHNNGVPCVQVLHSEHPSDTPVEHPMTRGFVMIRKGQEMFLRAAEPWSAALPRALIRNPIGFHRSSCDRGRSDLARTIAGVLCSEFDDSKVDLAAEYARRCKYENLPVVLVGPWRSERPVPDGCIKTEATMHVWPFYRRAVTACSYRYSRTLPEALHCATPVWVKGGLEPERHHGEEGPEDWQLVGAEAIDFREHEYEHVAAKWKTLLETVLGR